MGKQRGLDFIAGIIVGAVLMSLASRFISSPPSKLPAPQVKPVTPIPQSTAAQNTLAKQPAVTARVETAQKMTPKKIRLPLLPPPEFAPTLPQVLYSDPKGQVFLQWLPVDNARRYQVYITDDKNHRVKLAGFVHTSIYLTGLPPPAINESERVYWVKIATQNKDQAAGEYGPKRKIVYLGKALSTPKIESIHVEE